MSYIGLQYADNATLFNGTLTTTGVGSAIDTTGYVQSVWQLSGNTFSGIITVETSLDGVYWSPTIVTELASLGPKSQIETDGVYLVKADGRYIRYNVTNISGTATLLILGNNYLSSNPVDRVSLAMDETNNTPLNVKLQLQNSGIKQDASGAFILSDAPTAVTTVQLATGGTTVIDTTGYQTIHLTTSATFAATGGIAFSNDGVTYVQAPMSTVPGVWSTTFVALTNYTIPVQGRFAKIIATSAGQFTYYLRNIPSQLTGQNLAAIGGTGVSATTAQLGMNIVQYGGTAVITGGVAGVPAAGGPNTTGTATTTNPLQIGAIDPLNIVRRATSTMLGDLITSNRTVPSSNAALGSATTGNAPITNAGFNNQVALSVQDTSEYDGQDQVELLAQILQELKILNQQIYELPKVQAAAFQGSTVPATGTIVQLGDEPTQMRNDASLFINQQ